MTDAPDFKIQEFVPKEIYSQFGDRSQWFVDPRLPKLAQAIRDILGEPIVINSWFIGGPHNDSGYRTPEETTGAHYSQHKFGRAMDIKCHLWTGSYEDARNFIRSHWDTLHPLGLTTIELGTPTWLHVDMRWTGLDHLLEVPYR